MFFKKNNLQFLFLCIQREYLKPEPIDQSIMLCGPKTKNRFFYNFYFFNYVYYPSDVHVTFLYKPITVLLRIQILFYITPSNRPTPYRSSSVLP